MRQVSSVDARKDFSELMSLTTYAKERIIITKNNKPAVVIMPIEDLEILEALEKNIDLALALDRLKEDDGVVSLKEVKKQLGLLKE